MNILHFEILDKKRSQLLPLFTLLKSEFYLAGGTALALTIGHRDSVDFDFFSPKPYQTEKLFQKLQAIFNKHSLEKVVEEENTLTILLDNIKISFFTYPYQLISPLIETEYLNLASIIDIGCMKLAAIASRATTKDYVDLYFILKEIKFPELLKSCLDKYPQLDSMLILKSLVYFKDLQPDPFTFMSGKEVSLVEIEDYFQKLAKEYFNQLKNSL